MQGEKRMKERKTIKYIKNGEEITKEYNILTRNKLLNDLFKKPYYQTGSQEVYSINEDIEYLSMTNITFSKNVKMVIPDDSTVELNNCTFQGESMYYIGGNIVLNNPNINPDNYTNRVYLNNTNDANIVIDSNNRGFISIIGSSKNFSIKANNRIETIYLTADKATLQDIYGIKSLKLITKNATIKNCSFKINLDNQSQNIKTDTLDIENSNLYYMTDELSKDYEIIKADEIVLRRSTIDTNNQVTIIANSTMIDKDSILKVKNYKQKSIEETLPKRRVKKIPKENIRR